MGNLVQVAMHLASINALVLEPAKKRSVGPSPEMDGQLLIWLSLEQLL
jgi:hypothetical protein